MLHYKLKASLLSVAAIVVLTGCGGNKVDVLAYPTKVKSKVMIPEVCMPQYKSAMPSVAVMEFTNNSTFGKFTRNRNKSLRKSLNSRISSAIIGPLETVIVNSGGAKLFTRSDMDKIDAELKFQDSGLVDTKSIVRFGRTSGVRFIMTGSIDNVKQKYRGNTAIAVGSNFVTAKSDKEAIKLMGVLLAMGASVTDGMLITTTMTVKLLDVETGKIIFSKQLEEEVNIGKIRKPNFDQIIGGIKAAMFKSLPALKEDLSIYFMVKGYVTKLKAKDNEVIAQVNLGRDFKVEEDQIFKVYAFEENEDPMSGEISCDVIETTTTLRASQQITAKSTWTTVQEGNPGILKLGQLVQKTHEKAGFAIPTF